MRMMFTSLTALLLLCDSNVQAGQIGLDIYSSMSTGSRLGGDPLVLRQCVSADLYNKVTPIGSIGFDMGAGDDQDYCVYFSAEKECLGETRAVEWTTHAEVLMPAPDGLGKSVRVTKGSCLTAKGPD